MQSMQSRQTRSGLSKDTNRKVSIMYSDHQTFAVGTARAWHVVSRAKASCNFLSGICAEPVMQDVNPFKNTAPAALCHEKTCWVILSIVEVDEEDDTRHHQQQHHPSSSTVRPYLLNISDDISLAGRQELAVRPQDFDEFQTVFGAGSYTSCQRVHPSALALRTGPMILIIGCLMMICADTWVIICASLES